MSLRRALLFDLDGTMAITDPVHELAWSEILRALGIEADHDFYQRYIAGQRNAEIVATILPHMPAPEATALADSKERRYRELLTSAGLSPVDGLPSLLVQCEARGWATAVVTNAPRANSDQVLRTLGFQFDVCITADDLPLGKPDPLPYRTALQRLGLGAADAVAFEDSPAGIRSAVGAGITTVALQTTHDAPALTAAGASLVVENFEAPALLRLLFDEHAR